MAVLMLATHDRTSVSSRAMKRYSAPFGSLYNVVNSSASYNFCMLLKRLVANLLSPFGKSEH